MITGGHANVFVSNMDRAIQFYTDTLGLKLTHRFGDNWATVRAGNSLVIGLHPASAKYPAPGTKGAIMIDLVLGPDRSIEEFHEHLKRQKVRLTSAIIGSEAGNYISFEDPDGNSLYIGDWDPDLEEPEDAGARARSQPAGSGVR